ncbi:putative NAD-specific glutamate dehydrogenase [Thioclava atlantica]|uniref:Putative NAD-specific glutamate dehydrogenase n=1 Tax=Thioclava atlantica TaxID=1317124 RepID=A0A085TVH6_9RHOB|nr:putative NAD-specific glutamate dehydrogenase [Thioclava atlantica]
MRLLALVVAHVLEVGVDDIVIDIARTFLIRGLGFARFLLLGLVDGLAEFHRGVGEVLDRTLDLAGFLGLERLFERIGRQFDHLDGGRIDLVAMLFERLACRMQERLALVLGLDEFLAALVGLGIRLGVLNHLLDLVIRETARSLDRDLLLLAGALVLRRNGHDAVGVDVEGHFDLRHAARRRRDVLEIEHAQQLVVRGHLALALEDADRHRVLVVFRGREDLRLLGRDRGVAVDQAGEDTTQRLDAERQRGHVEQDHVLHVALQNAGLDRRAERHDLIGVHALVRLLAEELGHLFDDFRHPGHAADQNDLVDLVLGDARIFQRGRARLERGLDQVVHEAFELRTGQFHDHVQRRAVLAHRDEGLVDLGLARARELDLRLLGRFLQTLQRHLVLGEIDAMLFLELVSQVVDDPHVEVFATQEGVAIGRLHLEQTIVDLEDGDVERTATEVIDGDRLGLFLVEAIGERGRGRLVDDAQNLETGDLARILRGLTLGVVEIGGNGDHGLRDFLAQIALGGFLHLLQDDGRNLRGRIFLALHFDPGIAIAAIDDGVGDELLVLLDFRIGGAAADQALHGEDGVGRVGHRLAFCRLADQAFIVGKGDDRGRGARPFGILDHPGLRAVHDGDAGVRGPEVDADDFGHDVTSLGDMAGNGSIQAPGPYPLGFGFMFRPCAIWNASGFAAYIRRAKWACKNRLPRKIA